ncbi:hypothetical protein ACP275_14G266800 [Erythranthe tilingii]
MIMFYQEDPPNHSKKSKCIASSLKSAFTNFPSFRAKLPQTEEPVVNFHQEDEIFVSTIISKYLESKSKRKSSNDNIIIGADLRSFFYLATVSRPPVAISGGGDAEEYFSATGCLLSRCSSASAGTTTFDDAFVSAKTRLSRCSSLDTNTNIVSNDFQDFDRRRSIIAELIQYCEGWPFGLCRKAILLPPLPKSPADSWSWIKSSGRIVK